MAMDTSAPNAAAPVGPGDDLSALSWVRDELRRSLELANKALRRYLKEQAQRSDLDSVDPAVLRQARNQLHQCVGVLELVGLGPAAELPRAAEAALLRISARPKLVTPAAVDALERGSFALLDFIERRLAGKPVSALALFPQYKALQELAGALRVHPADLWGQPWAWRDLALDASVPARHPDAGTTAQIEADLLALMRGASPGVAGRMSAVFAGLARGAQALADTGDLAAHAPHSRLATLWQLAAGFFEAQADGLLQPDAYSKRLGSKLLAQLRAGETAEPSERLAHDLLFFCSQASTGAGQPAGALLAAVRQGYALADGPGVDYTQPSLGRFDPAWVAQARKRVAGAKDVWSAVAGGDATRLDSLAEQFALVGDSLGRLYADGAVLAQALQATAVHTVAAGTEPPADLAMEVATALLYLDASIEDADFDHPDSGRRVQRLAARIDAVRQGQDPGTLELWMEELYRRVSDRQTMGSVVQELRSALSEVEKNIDQYFRNPAQRDVLIPVPAQLQAMRGVLSVLGLEQASHAVLRMRDDVDALANTEVNAQHAIESGSFERLADNLGALSFLIDMVSVQPQMAKSLFQFDVDTGNLKAVMAREERPTSFDAMDTQSGDDDRARPDTDALAVTLEFDRIVEQARGHHPAGRHETRHEAPAAPGRQGLPTLLLDGQGGVDLPPLDLSETTLVLPTLPTGSPVPDPAAALPTLAPAALSSGLEDDPEMREIFLEEAAEVLDNARSALATLQGQPDDADAMNTVRRAFHTLKGSARMVGLLGFGEAAWACEQLYNTRLAAHSGADAELLAFSQEACGLFGDWVQALADGDAATHGPQAIVRGADALRTGQLRQPPAAAAQDGMADAAGDGAAAVPLVPAGETLALTELSLADLDLAGLGLDDAQHDVPPGGQPALAEVGADDDFTLDLRLRVPDLPAAADLDLAAPAAPPSALPLPEIHLADLDDVPGFAERTLVDLPRMPVEEAAPLPGLPMVQLPEAIELDLAGDVAAAFGAPAAAAEPALEPEPERAADAEAENVRQIGPLRIGIPLFNIYLNEADELSRRLGVALAEWALEQQRPVGDATVALAHSLAGSSGTVGFADLSQLARALEHALERAQARGHGKGDEATLFGQAADEIRRLLHLFAAGFLHAPDPDLVARLQELAHAAPDVEPEVEVSDLLPLDPVPDTAAEVEAEVAPVQVPAFVAEPEPESEPEPEPEPEALPPAISAGPVPEAFPGDAAHASFGRAALLPFAALADLPQQQPLRSDDDGLIGGVDDDIDAVDAVDEDLFQVFSEEAQELLPVLHAGLRDWARQPGDAEAPSACMRCLHTFKGSARLAGAMRLGEMAHRLESLVQRLAAAGAQATAAEIEVLSGHADSLQARLDTLLHPAAVQAPAPAVTAPAATAAAPAAAPVVVAPVARPGAAPPAAAGAAPAALRDIDWQRFTQAPAVVGEVGPATGALAGVAGSVRVRTPLLDRLVNQAGEVSIARSRIESDVQQFKGALGDLSDNLERLRAQLRDIELQAETQIETRMEAARAASQAFDPLEMDRFTRFQELTRMMAESVADVATVQRGLQRTLQSTEDALAHQARMTRDMQDDLLRTRMVEFEGLSERLYRVVRQAAKETGKPVRLDILGGGVEIDRGVLDRMTPAFEHLLRNSVVHGIEPVAERTRAGKDSTGTITVAVTQVGNEVGVEVRDDGAGLNLPRILARGQALGLVAPEAQPDDAALANLIFQPGFSTAENLTGLAGRGVGMDVVRTDVNAMGGRIETASAPGQGTSFRLLLPLTTAVTQVVMLRCGERAFAVPSTLIETVRRIKLSELAQAYQSGGFSEGGQLLPFFWFDGLLGGSAHGAVGSAVAGRSAPVVVIRSAQQRVVLHVDEVLGNQEVVVKNLGPQLSRVPGLVGMTLLPSGLPALIYNPVALATLYGDSARAATVAALGGSGGVQQPAVAQPLAPLVLVVDDSLTVRRITQRLLEREGYRVAVAKDGLDGLDKLAAERPAVLLTDIEMPRMDGFDLVRNMRTDARLADLPVIMITSRIAQKHRDYAAELGVDHYLGKPYAEDELLALVARYARAAALAAAA
ncbi:MAG: Hpt domain-containing protein [Pseudomonadota bacterium]